MLSEIVKSEWSDHTVSHRSVMGIVGLWNGPR